MAGIGSFWPSIAGRKPQVSSGARHDAKASCRRYDSVLDAHRARRSVGRSLQEATMRRAVVVIADGLRRDAVSPAQTPTITALRARGSWFASHRPVFPSATRVSSASFATGCWPATHGLQGNTVALLEAGRPVRHDVGDHRFFSHWRGLTGATLRVPTLARRLRGLGGAVVYANASPGAALAHDPDGDGVVRHRAFGQGPGRTPLPPLPVVAEPAGDAEMTARFLAEVLPRRPALAVLWLGGPDVTQHAAPLGSPAALAALGAADACIAAVAAGVAAQRKAGDEVLLILGADHGHETVAEVIDLDAELVAAGLKAGAESDDVVVCSNGTAALIYTAPEVALAPLGAWLAAQPWAGSVHDAAALPALGQAAEQGLAFAVAMRVDMAPNAHGVLGLARAVKPAAGKPDRLGCGQHGGLGPHEGAPFLLIDGPGFAPGATVMAPSRIIDLAPSILRHLAQPETGCDGVALQPG